MVCETWKEAEREEGLLGARAITGEEGARSLIESVSSMQRSGIHHKRGALPKIWLWSSKVHFGLTNVGSDPCVFLSDSIL